ncbi:signal peptidase I [Planomicrobium okeanokoites]|uniref:Signal peptidase I n=1 Tax=Planomicrobium okeanokoites TaxID=244 RepID=A0ABV7KSC5_PLAOK|nr:signal peptidase I [Planomicrobium okeanokoites]TAA70220.1 signal peptidase I [Planomicrobium okeanokoites]
MNKFKRDLDEFVGESPRFNEPLKRKILNDMKKEQRPANRFADFKYAAVLMLLLTVVTTFLVLNMGENNTDPSGPAGTTSELPALTDPDTVPEIEMVEAKENTILVEWGSDAMDRGNHDYDTITNSSLVVEMEYEEVRRGDVVYYKTPVSAINKNSNLPEYYIARVVGLPGETVVIREGQIYVDDKKLDTFYGAATSLGLSKDEYFKMVERNVEEGTLTTDIEVSEEEQISWVNVDSMKEYFATSMEPVKVSNEAVFVLVDQWWRGTDSRDFGELPLEAVEGKVLGYAKD